MTRLTLSALFATLLAGPWSGCDRAPLTPPANPPDERAPFESVLPSIEGIILLDEFRQRG